MSNKINQLLQKAGCLEPYARLTLMMREENIDALIQYASSLKGFLCNYQVPLLYVISSVSRGKMAEIGVYYGRTTSIIKLANKDIDLYCVDPFTGSEEHQEEMKKEGITSYYDNFGKNMKDRGHKVTVIVDYSVQAAKHFDDETLDLVWIDGAHDEWNVRSDINTWLPKLKTGGIMLGHDYPANGDFKTGGFEELVKAVTLEVKDNARFQEFGEFCGIWGAIKS